MKLSTLHCKPYVMFSLQRCLKLFLRIWDNKLTQFVNSNPLFNMHIQVLVHETTNMLNLTLLERQITYNISTQNITLTR